METLLKEVERGVKNWYLPLLAGIILLLLEFGVFSLPLPPIWHYLLFLP